MKDQKDCSKYQKQTENPRIFKETHYSCYEKEFNFNLKSQEDKLSQQQQYQQQQQQQYQYQQQDYENKRAKNDGLKKKQQEKYGQLLEENQNINQQQSQIHLFLKQLDKLKKASKSQKQIMEEAMTIIEMLFRLMNKQFQQFQKLFGVKQEHNFINQQIMNENIDLLGYKVPIIRDRVFLAFDITPKKNNEIIDEDKFSYIMQLIYRFGVSQQTKIKFIIKVDQYQAILDIFMFVMIYFKLNDDEMNELEFLGVLKTLTMQFYRDFKYNKIFREIKSVVMKQEVFKDGNVDFDKLETLFKQEKLNVEDILHMILDDIRYL